MLPLQSAHHITNGTYFWQASCAETLLPRFRPQTHLLADILATTMFYSEMVDLNNSTCPNKADTGQKDARTACDSLVILTNNTWIFRHLGNMMQGASLILRNANIVCCSAVTPGSPVGSLGAKNLTGDCWLALSCQAACYQIQTCLQTHLWCLCVQTASACGRPLRGMIGIP